MQWVIKISVIVVGLAGTGLTFLDNSVLVFWMVGVDMSYTIMFPQLVCVLFFDLSNSYGAMSGFILGIVLRFMSGEPLVSLEAVIKFPGGRIDDAGNFVQYFPYRTFIMVLSVLTILGVSYVTSLLFSKGVVPLRFDLFKIKEHEKALQRPQEKCYKEGQKVPSVSKQLLETTSC